MRRICLRFKKRLSELKERGYLVRSQMARELLDFLRAHDLVELKIVGRGERIVTKESFYLFFDRYCNTSELSTRSELAKAGFGTKDKKISYFQHGLYVAGNARINGIDLSKIDDGVLFVSKLHIQSDPLIVGVENFENLLYAKHQIELFAKDVLFIFRNRAFLEFIQGREILYFGDIDLAGIAIFLKEILPRAAKASFFIPKNIEELLQTYGNRELYYKQLAFYKDLSSQDEAIQRLIELLHSKRKVLEQEVFI